MPFPQLPADLSVLRQYWQPAGDAAAVNDRDVRIQKCCVRIVPRILTTDPRTGGIRNWGRNRAVKTHRLVTSAFSSAAQLLISLPTTLMVQIQHSGACLVSKQLIKNDVCLDHTLAEKQA